jgi:hypothetical protein
LSNIIILIVVRLKIFTGCDLKKVNCVCKSGSAFRVSGGRGEAWEAGKFFGNRCISRSAVIGCGLGWRGSGTSGGAGGAGDGRGEDCYGKQGRAKTAQRSRWAGSEKDPGRNGNKSRIVPSGPPPPGGDTLIGGYFRLCLPLLQIFLCLIREYFCPCFPAKTKIAPTGIIQGKTGSKTCQYRSLWMDDLRPRQAPVNRGVADSPRTKGRPLRTGGRVFTSVHDGEPGFSPSSRIFPGMAVVPGHHDAVRELGLVPRVRFLFAGGRRQPDILITGIFSKAPQAGVGGFCGVHAGKWGRAGGDPPPSFFQIG